MRRYPSRKALKKESSIVKRAVDAAGADTFWDEAFTLAVDDLRDGYGINDNGDSIYVNLTDRYGGELPYQGYVSFEGVKGGNLYLHVVYPKDISASILACAEERVDMDEVRNVSSPDKRLLKRKKLDIQQYIEVDMFMDIADTMGSEGYVDELVIFQPDEGDVDYDPEYHDDEREAVLLAARDLIKWEIESYIERVSREASDVVDDAENAVSQLTEEIEGMMDMASNGRMEHRNRRPVRCMRGR